jgi:hypothetical protein
MDDHARVKGTKPRDKVVAGGNRTMHFNACSFEGRDQFAAKSKDRLSKACDQQ